MIVAFGLIVVVCGVAIVAPAALQHWRVWRAQVAMNKRFKMLLTRMQSPESGRAWESISKATPEQLAAARDAYMRQEASMYRIQKGLPPNYEDLE